MSVFEVIGTAVITGFGFGLGIKVFGAVDWLIGWIVVYLMQLRKRSKAP